MPDRAGDLAGPDCHAVVVGTGRQAAGEAAAFAASSADGARLTDLPSAADTARALARVLREHCGMADRVTEVIDPESPTDVLHALRSAVDRAEGGTVLFCFTGHGLLGPRRQLYLATARTATADDTVNAVPYAEVRNLLADASARTVVVLDCCFSGRAEAAPSDAHRDPYASARPDGSFLLASATHYAASFAPVGAEHTLFGGELIRLLTAGDPGGPRWLTLIDLYRILDRRFQGGPARPYADGVGRAGDLVVAPNAGYPAAVDAGGAPEAERERGADSAGPCPYPGMRPFLPEQRHLFFGREESARALLDRVRHGTDPGPVVLVGASGAGKSSLLRAGLVAGLEDLGGSRVLLVPGPGAHPFRTLVEHWSRAVRRPFAEVERELGSGRFGGGAGPEGGPDVLIVDQLEEIFTECEDPEERELFLRAVTGDAHDSGDAGDSDGPDGPDDNTGHSEGSGHSHGSGPSDGSRPSGRPGHSGAASAARPRIVLGLRADFYGACLRDARLARVAQAGQFTLGAMSDDELRAAIERPAEHAGLRLEDGLAEHLLHELRRESAGAGEAVALPFLAHALQQTWARRRGTLLTFAGYEASGGIRRSVARVADEVHDSLDAEGRARLRALLLRMVTLVDADGRAVRRRLPVPEPGGGADGDADRELLGLLADARLVVLDRGVAQLCHDSLLHGWPRLRDWIRDDRVGLLVRRRFGDAADTWEEAGRPDSALYRGDQLASARSLLREPGDHVPSARPRAEARAAGAAAGPLRPVERDFLRASERAEHRARRVRRAVVAVVSVLAVLAGLLAFVARDALREAESRETLLIARRLAAQADAMRERDPQTALRLSLAAYRTAETSETRSSLYAAYTSRPQVDLPAGGGHDPVVNLAYSADGKVLAVAQSNGVVRPWDVTRPTVPVPGKTLPKQRGAAAIAFHPRSRLLAVLGPDALTLWDTADPADPRPVGRLPLPRTSAFSLAFSPDGRTLAGGGAKGLLRLWDVSDPASPRQVFGRTVATAHLMAVAFHRDGRFLATGNGIGKDGKGRETPAQVRLWDVRTPAAPALHGTVTAASVMAVAFHPKRDLLVATGGKNAMAWWRVDTGGPGHEGGRLVRIVAKEPYENTWGAGDAMPSLSFRRDGEMLAAADTGGAGGGRTRAVDDGDGPELLETTADREILPGGEPVQSVAYSPDGAHLAVGDVGGNVRLWPERTAALALRGTLEYAAPGATAVSGDGRLALTSEARVGDGAMGRLTRVWDLRAADTRKGTAPRLVFTLPPEWEANDFLPGRDRPLVLAHRWGGVGSRDHAFRIWDLGGDGPPVAGPEIAVRAPDVSTAVSSDGRLLVVAGSPAPRGEVWDIGDPRRPVKRGTVTVAPAGLTDTMSFFGPRTLATVEDASGDGVADDLRLWDLTDPARPVRAGAPLEGVAGGRAAYLPRTRTLITDHIGQRAKLWDLTDVRHPRLVTTLAAASGGYTPVGGGRHGTLLATTLADGTVRLLDVRNGAVVHTMRFDREITDVVASGDGGRVLTGAPYRVWDIAPDGRWVTPAFATLEGADGVTLPPGKSPFLLVRPDRSNLRGTEYTFLLDRDSDAVYDRLCTTNPLDVGREQWKALFPDLAYRASC
ncbi:caspase family protein [Streptomyces sp. NPDC059071]|uniref:caspase, EACC1-associated type n=1 Tax=unclassified Streptomyces TaxID=2593676 RepID=UPI003647ECCB